MWPSTLTQLIGFFAAIGAALVGALQGWKWYLNTLEEKAKSKDQVAIAKYKDNIFSASQVMELMKATQEVKHDIVQIKADNEDRNEELTKAMDKLENNLKNFEDTFQKFIIARLNQFDQTLLK